MSITDTPTDTAAATEKQPADAADAPQSSVLDALVNNHRDHKPEVNPAAIAAAEADEQASPNDTDRADATGAGPSSPPHLSSDGDAQRQPPPGDKPRGGFLKIDGHTIQVETFNDAIHCRRATGPKKGQPWKKKDGTYRLKPHVQKYLDQHKGQGGAAPVTAEDRKRIETETAAKVVTESVIIITAALSGSENTASEQERANLHAAWSEYLATQNVPMPEWVPPLIVTGAYMAPRFSEPQAQQRVASRLQQLKEWLAVRFVRFGSRRKTQKESTHAHADPGPDDERQDLSKSDDRAKTRGRWPFGGGAGPDGG